MTKPKAKISTFSAPDGAETAVVAESEFGALPVSAGVPTTLAVFTFEPVVDALATNETVLVAPAARAPAPAMAIAGVALLPPVWARFPVLSEDDSGAASVEVEAGTEGDEPPCTPMLCA